MSTTAPAIRTFGPYHTVGLSYIAGNGNVDFPGVWDRLMKQIIGVLPTEGVRYFGVCRCLPGVKDGTWEYLATIQVPAGTKAPAGLKEVDIPRGAYLVGEVASLKEIGAAWQSLPKTAAEMKDYGTYCGPAGCECAQHPSFELYESDFSKTGKLAVYVPLKPR